MTLLELINSYCLKHSKYVLLIKTHIMKENLASKTFLSANELTEFVNDTTNKIVQKNIVSITTSVKTDGEFDFHIFYYIIVELTAEEKEEQKKKSQATRNLVTNAFNLRR